MGIFEQVARNIDRLVENNVDWSRCASNDEIANARDGKISLHLLRQKPVPEEWLPDVRGLNVLCLAGAGGLQAPILAAAGAKVTVVDISERMLEKDKMMAERYALDIGILKGNMCDLSNFADETFDIIVNPASMMYLPDPLTAFRECARVIKRGGALLMAAPAPVNYLCDFDAERGEYIARNRMPYSSAEHEDQGDWIEYGHTMDTYLGGLTLSGFAIVGYTEEQSEDITKLMFALKAIKL